MKNTQKPFKLKKVVFTIYLALLIAGPLVFIVLPIDYFDTGDSVCLSELCFDTQCYGCGMTKALKHLVFFDFSGAWTYNKLSFAVLPLIVVLWVQEVLRVRKKVKP